MIEVEKKVSPGKSNNSVAEYLKRLRDNKGGAFEAKALKHGGSIRAIAATAASQIHAALDKMKRDVLTVQRRQLPELFSMKACKTPRAGQPPALKASVREHLRARGIKVVYSGGLVDFIRQKPKVNPDI
jgi:hypothetical protein